MCSTLAVVPNVTTATRSPDLRFRSTLWISSSTLFWAAVGIERERSATTITSIPFPPRFIRGPASAATSAAKMATRSQPVTPGARPHWR